VPTEPTSRGSGRLVEAVTGAQVRKLAPVQPGSPGPLPPDELAWTCARVPGTSAVPIQSPRPGDQ